LTRNLPQPSSGWQAKIDFAAVFLAGATEEHASMRLGDGGPQIG